MKPIAEIKKKICEHLKNGSGITETCSKVGIARRTYYLWLNKYPKFKEEIELILFNIKDQEQSEAKRAMRKRIQGFYYEEVETRYVTEKDGTKKIKEIIVSKKHSPPSTRLIIKTLESLRPNEWGRKKSVETTSNSNFEEFLKKNNVDEKTVKKKIKNGKSIN